MLVLDGVSLSIENIPLLTNVSLRCAPSSVTVLMGPNGAGKTSLLSVISTDYKATSGSIDLGGKAQQQWQASERARFMAVLPQYSSLDFPFQVEEVVLLGRTPHNTGLKRDREIVRAALDQVDAGYLAKRLYTQLSGGEKQRVQLARVLAQVWPDDVQHSRIMLLDEPSASLDLAHQQLLRTIVKDFASAGGTVVMVMHDLNLAAMCADQMVFMTCGQLIAAGTPEALLTPETIEKVFSVSADVIKHPSSGRPLVVL